MSYFQKPLHDIEEAKEPVSKETASVTNIIESGQMLLTTGFKPYKKSDEVTVHSVLFMSVGRAIPESMHEPVGLPSETYLKRKKDKQSK